MPQHRGPHRQRLLSLPDGAARQVSPRAGCKARVAVRVLCALSTVHVDNNSKHDVHLELNGQLWKTAGRGETHRTTLRRGTYSLVVKAADTGAELDRRTIEVGGAGVYVLNVLGA